MAGWQDAKLPFYPKKMKQLNVSAPPPPPIPHNLSNTIKEMFSHFTHIQKGKCDFFQRSIICH